MLYILLKVLNEVLLLGCAYIAAIAGWEFIHAPEKGWWPGFIAIIMLLQVYNYWSDKINKL